MGEINLSREDEVSIYVNSLKEDVVNALNKIIREMQEAGFTNNETQNSVLCLLGGLLIIAMKTYGLGPQEAYYATEEIVTAQIINSYELNKEGGQDVN